MAIMATPMTPATPMLATLTEAAPVEELPLAPVVVVAPDDGLADETAGVVAVVVAAGVVAAGVVAAGVVVAAFVVAGALEDGAALPELLDPDAEEPPEAELPPPFKQLVSDPPLIVNGAEEAVVPVLSRMVRPMEVPAAMSVFHVNEVPVCWPRFSRAEAVGSLPGRMLKK